MKEDSFEIDIPTKGYIKKYMEVMHGNPIAMTRRDPHGKLLFNLLERNSHENDSDYYHYPVLMRVRLNAKMYHRRGTNLSYTGITEFNNTVEHNFKSLLRMFVYAQMNAPQPRKKTHAINDFIKLYGFEPDEFPFDTAKKDIDRNIDRLIN